jgi:glutamate N-acetyltransferase/amino-acid N-acetyltransferase
LRSFLLAWNILEMACRVAVFTEKWYILSFMKANISVIKQGTVTSAQGFKAGAADAGIKYAGRLDLGLLYSDAPCVSTAVFTSNRVKAAPVLVSLEHMKGGKASAVIVNSGCANACTGKAGMKAAREMAKLAAAKLKIKPEQVIVASTGVIGTHMPVERVKSGLAKMKLDSDGGHKLARAIMTTDTQPKETALKVTDYNGTYVIGGIAKGAGMIHPDMATLLSFLTTDARVELKFLRQALKKAVSDSFNMITVDGDTSTNDMVSLMANGAAGTKEINSRNGKLFQDALNRVCRHLACCIAADGEGASKLIEVNVAGAKTAGDARKAARTIAGSALVKSAMHGNDPNWGRIVASLGRSGAYFEEGNVDVFLQGKAMMKDGAPLPLDKATASASLKKKKVIIEVKLNLGPGRATAWGCDLSEEYVTINSDYTT